MSHTVIESIIDVGSLISAFAGLGALAATVITPIAPVLALEIAAFKLMDQGKGLIFTRYGWIGPIIPTPQ